MTRARSRASVHATRAITGLDGKFAKIARVFSRDFKVDVVLAGLRCCTDGDTIYLPANADYLKGADAAVLEGMLDHEWSHVREEREAKERRESWKRRGRVGPEPRTPLEIMRGEGDPRVRLLTNWFEDLRIERRASAKWPGVARHLSVLRDHMAKLYETKPEEYASGDFWQVLGACISATVQGQPVEPWAPALVRRLVGGLLAEEVEATRTTRYVEECHALARSVVAKIDTLWGLSREERREREEHADDEGEESEDVPSPGESSEGAPPSPFSLVPVRSIPKDRW